MFGFADRFADWIFRMFTTVFRLRKPEGGSGKYGAQNEAYKCLLVDKVVNDLCLS